MQDFRMDTFLTVCKQMNYTRAADELHITQPAVSQHIRFLEQRYGVRLFSYEGKRLSLTPEGQLLLQSAHAAQADEATLQKHLASLARRRGTLALGATLTIGEYVIADMVARYLKHRPDTEVRIAIGNTSELLGRLNAGELDLALMEGYFPKGAYESQVYSHEEYVAVSNHAESPTELEVLFSRTLILREEGSGTRDVLAKGLEQHNYTLADFPSHLECGGLHAIKTLVTLGCGITFLYRRAVERELREGTLFVIPIRGFALSHDFTFLWRKGSVFSSQNRSILPLLCGEPEAT